MSEVDYMIALGLLAGGVGLALMAVAAIITALRRGSDEQDERLFGDLPKVPEFINRRRDEE